eukprot:gene7977-1193_t
MGTLRHPYAPLGTPVMRKVAALCSPLMHPVCTLIATIMTRTPLWQRPGMPDLINPLMGPPYAPLCSPLCTPAYAPARLALMQPLCSPYAAPMQPTVTFGKWWINFYKRTSGEPKKGPVIFVSSRIEEYEKLKVYKNWSKMQSVHNRIVHKACCNNYGHVVQECNTGTFTIIFSNAMDAAAYCLQVQLALLSAQWPGLEEFGPEKRKSGHDRASTSESQDRISVRSLELTTRGTEDRTIRGSEDRTSRGSEDRTTRGTDERTIQRTEERITRGSRTRSSFNTQHTNMPSLLRPHSAPLSPSRQAAYHSNAQVNFRHSDSWTNLVPSEASRVPDEEFGSGSDRGHPLSTPTPSFNIALAPGAKRVCGFGPRVCMALTHAVLQQPFDAPETDVQTVLRSNTSSGGQMLLDEESYLAFKEQLEELGTVDENGFNSENPLKSWNKKKKKRIDWLPKMSGPSDSSSLSTTSHGRVTSLDMGLYLHQADGQRPQVLTVTDLFGIGAEISDVTDLSKLSTASFNSALSKSERSRQKLQGGAEGTPDRIRVYQLLHLAFINRLNTFCDRPRLPAEWICVDPPYLTAPGAKPAILPPEQGSADQLPPMTMVFCSVEGARLFNATHWGGNAPLHQVCSSVLYSTFQYAGFNLKIPYVM